MLRKILTIFVLFSVVIGSFGSLGNTAFAAGSACSYPDMNDSRDNTSCPAGEACVTESSEGVLDVSGHCATICDLANLKDGQYTDCQAGENCTFELAKPSGQRVTGIFVCEATDAAIPECNTVGRTNQCATNEICSGGQCVTVTDCTNDANCPSGFVCDSDESYCRIGCRSTSNCPIGKYCTDSKICLDLPPEDDVKTGNAGTGEGASCDPVGEYCQDGSVCQKTGWWIFGSKKCVAVDDAVNKCKDDEIWFTEVQNGSNFGRCISIEELTDKYNCGPGTSFQYDPINNARGCFPTETSKVGSCDFKTLQNFGTLSNYLKDIFIQGGILIGLNTLTGALNEGGPEISFLGIGGKLPAGLVEGLDDVADFVLKKWLSIVLWGLVATVGVMIGGAIIGVGLDININYLIENNGALDAGYGVILSLANIGFVIAIVVMGIMLILRRREWDIGKVLPRFALSVILVNFGLFIAGILVDLSSVLMKGFLGDRCLWINLFNSFSIHNLNWQFDKAGYLSIAGAFSGSGISNAVFGALLNNLSLIFATIFSAVGALTTLAVAFFLIIRYVAITILLVFMPLAWLGLAVPKLKIGKFGNPWKFWWDQFMQWLIFGPIIAFFLYLGSSLTTGIATLQQPTGGSYPLAGLLQVIVALVISAGGLFVAKSMSVLGSGLITAGVGWAVGLGTGLIGKARNPALRGQLSAEQQAAALREKGDIKGAKKLERKARLMGGLGQVVQSPAFGGMGKTFGVPIKTQKPMTTAEFKEKGISEAAKDLAGMSNAEKAQEFDRLTKFSGKEERRMAILKDLQKSKKLGLIKETSSAMERLDQLKMMGENPGDYEVGFGMDKASYSALQKFRQATDDDTKAQAREELSGSLTKFYSGLSKKDFGNLPMNDIYGDKPISGMNEEEFKEFRKATTKAVLANPGDINRVAPNIKSKNYDTFFTSVVSEALSDTIVDKDTAKKIDELRKQKATVESALKAQVEQGKAKFDKMESDLTDLNSQIADFNRKSTSPDDKFRIEYIRMEEKKKNLENQLQSRFDAALDEQRRNALKEVSKIEKGIRDLGSQGNITKEEFLNNVSQDGKIVDKGKVMDHLKNENSNVYKAFSKTVAMRETGINPSEPEPTS